MAMLAAVNLRGVGESVKLNVGLTIIEITGLLLVIMVGLWAFTGGGADVDFSRSCVRHRHGQERVHRGHRGDLAGVLRDGRLRGFGEHGRGDEGPDQGFPKALLTGLSIAASSTSWWPSSRSRWSRSGRWQTSDTALVEVVKAGAPKLPIEAILPFISMFAVSNTALINMLMASRLIYGMARQHVLPPELGAVHPTRRTPWVAIVFTTAIAFGLIFYVTAFANSSVISLLGGTTSYCYWRCSHWSMSRSWCCGATSVGGGHFTTPTALPVIGCLASLYLVTPLSGRPGQQYLLALILIGIGIVLFFVTMLINRQLGIRGTGITDPMHLGAGPDE